ncbi:MAG: DUF559 domain-containing protein [Pedosphaera sp.]|nr:DUF559 domain-containing protein [Pedosphaera sp.]
MPDTALTRTLRKKQTWAEKLVWSWLRDRRFSAYKFRRQFPIGAYSLDFYCREASLSIELDGGHHGQPDQQVHDAERTKFLASMGIKELRFWNWQLRREKQLVRDAIFNALQERAPHPAPHYTKPMAPPEVGGKETI